MAPIKKTNKWNGRSDNETAGSAWNMETNLETLMRRQKQIDYGKHTKGYQKYVDAIPKEQRNQHQPKTPNKYQVCSRRCFDGQIKIWRLLLHAYDDVNLNEECNNNKGERGAIAMDTISEESGKSGDNSSALSSTNF